MCSFSFRPWRWNRRYPARDEILAYLHALVAEHGLGPRLRFGRGVASAEFDEHRAVWDLTLSDGDVLQASAVVCAVGQLGRPVLPGIPGRDEFTGPSWHSARWNHEADLAGRRVAVVGTGASAIQFVPEIAKVTGHVDVYQRPAVRPAQTRPALPRRRTGPVRPGVYRSQGRPAARLPLRRAAHQRLRPVPEAAGRADGDVAPPAPDPDRRSGAARPVRPGLRDGLQAGGVLQRLVSGPGPAGRRADHRPDRADRPGRRGHRRRHHPPRRRDHLRHRFPGHQFLVPMQVSGRGGVRLHEAWRDGAQAYLGITVCGFPNFFMLYGPNTNLGGNSIIYMLEGQIGYVLGALQALQANRLAWLDVRPDVQEEFNAWVQSASRATVWESGCHSWYTTDGRNINNWPDHTFLYRYRVRRFDLAAYQIMPDQMTMAGPGAS